jgi:hypothetical protein
MATAAVSSDEASYVRVTTDQCQNPPLYLRVTSTSKDGLDQAVKMIEEMLTQELPNLVDERRFRRREPENFERDEFGRVCVQFLTVRSIC